MARAAKEALARAKVAEIDDAGADEEEGEADDGAEAAEGNARARRRAAGSWRSRDISQKGKERAFSPHDFGKRGKRRRTEMKNSHRAPPTKPNDDLDLPLFLSFLLIIIFSPPPLSSSHSTRKNKNTKMNRERGGGGGGRKNQALLLM